MQFGSGSERLCGRRELRFHLAMSREQKRGKLEKGNMDVAEKVVVAVKASKEIPKTALVWALTHVVQPGDCITLLVVVSSQSSGKFPLCGDANIPPFRSSVVLYELLFGLIVIHEIGWCIFLLEFVDLLPLQKYYSKGHCFDLFLAPLLYLLKTFYLLRTI